MSKHKSGVPILAGLLIVGAILICLDAAAQQTGGKLTVRVVWKEYGTAVDKAKVRVAGQAAITDKKGECTLDGLAIGRHDVRVTARKFLQRQPVTIHVMAHQDNQIVVKLKPKPVYYVLHLIGAGATIYVFVFAMIMICLNYFVGFEPLESLTWSAGALVLASLLLAAFRLPPVTAIPLIAVEGLGAAILIRYAKAWARKHPPAKEPKEQKPTPEEKIAQKREALEGKVGITTSALRPSGTADFGAGNVEVTGQTGHISQNVKVRVESILPNKILVVPVEEPLNHLPSERKEG